MTQVSGYLHSCSHLLSVGRPLDLVLALSGWETPGSSSCCHPTCCMKGVRDPAPLRELEVCVTAEWNSKVGPCVPLKMSLFHVALSSPSSEKPTVGKPLW